MTVSVVIPNFNGSKLLRNNLSKIISKVGNAEVIVVDDASTDDSMSLLEKHFSQVKAIARKKNEGFASSVNEGVEKASGELILLLNSDVIPEKKFIEYLTSHFEDPKVFAVGCLQKNISSKSMSKEGRGIGKFEKGFLVHGPGDLDKKGTLWVFGGAGMFRKEVWDKLGGMDKIYNPFYWEDIDLSYRALKAGFKLVFEPKSIVTHHQESGAIRNLYSSEQIKTIAFRNQILFVWLNITDVSYLIEHLVFLPYHIIRALLRWDISFIKAFFFAILKIPKIIAHRVRNQEMNIISDKKILLNFAN